MSVFRGLSAFPLTPADEQGRVETDALAALVDRLCVAGVDSIGLLGSTGIYTYLTREERRRAVVAAVASASGRVPVLVGVGALRTDAACQLARDAADGGADALLLAPVSYTPLRQDEVFEHVSTVASVTSLPVCLYNNPTTTSFTFERQLLERLSRLPTIRAVKMPLPADLNFGEEIEDLRCRTDLAIGYSGDWGAAPALLAGADAWYSVLAGLLPQPTLELCRAGQAGDMAKVARLDDALRATWEAFRAFGSLRVMYVLHELLGFGASRPPLPILPLTGADRERAAAALMPLLPASR